MDHLADGTTGMPTVKVTIKLYCSHVDWIEKSTSRSKYLAFLAGNVGLHRRNRPIIVN